METQHTKHTTYKIGYHFVWCPKYRKDILTGERAAYADQDIRAIATIHGWTIGSLNVQEDHIHLFVSAPPRFSPSLIMNTLKSALARHLFKQFPDIRRQMWKGEMWSRSYYVGTIGDMSAEVVQRYIEERQD